jgi:hypothetical protein
VNDIGGRPEQSEGVGFGKPPKHRKIKNFSVVFTYILYSFI